MSTYINNDIFQYKDNYSIYNFKTVYNNLLIELSNTGVFNYILNPRFKFYNQEKCFAWEYPNNSISKTTSYTRFILNHNEKVFQNLTNLLYSDQQYSLKIICKVNKNSIVKLKSNSNIFLDQDGNNVNEIEINLETSEKFKKYVTIFDISDVNLENKDIKIEFVSLNDNTILDLKEVVLHKGLVQLDDLRHYGWFESNVKYNSDHWELTNNGIDYHRIILNDEWYKQDWIDKYDFWMDYAVNDNIEKGICVTYDKPTHKLNFEVGINALELNPKFKKLVKYKFIDSLVQKSGKDIIEINYDYIDGYYYISTITFGDGSYLKITYNYKVLRGIFDKFGIDTITIFDCIGNIYEQWKIDYSYYNNIILPDIKELTKFYKVYVENGEIKIKEISFDGELFEKFIVTSNGNNYEVYIENGQLHFKNSTFKKTFDINFYDENSDNFYQIKINGNNLGLQEVSLDYKKPLYTSIKKTGISDYDLFELLPLTDLYKYDFSADIKFSSQEIKKIEYTVDGEKQKIIYDNNYFTEIGYSKINNEIKKPTRITYFNFDGTLYESWKILYYSNGKIKSIINTFMKDREKCNTHININSFDQLILHSKKDMKNIIYTNFHKIDKIIYENDDYIKIEYINKNNEYLVNKIIFYDKNNSLLEQWSIKRDTNNKIESIMND